MSIPKAHSLLRALALVPDLLIFSPAISDSAEFIRTLRRDSPDLRVVAAVDEDLQLAGRIPADLHRWGRKPRGLIIPEGAILAPMVESQMEDRLRPERAEWLLIVRTVLDSRAASAD